MAGEKTSKTTRHNVQPRYGRVRRLFAHRFLRLGASVAAFMLMLPLLLTLIYAIPVIKPVSTLMMGRTNPWKAG